MDEDTQLSFLESKEHEGPPDKGGWDFRRAHTQNHTHGLHPYPARMIPQIASRLLDLYGPEAQAGVVADVFCGSGSVNVEASVKGYRSIGIDINPFAVLLAKAKVTSLANSRDLRRVRSRLEAALGRGGGRFPELVPKYKNIEHWFKPDALDKLSHLKRAIQATRRTDLRNLLWIAFANTVMKSSNVDWKSSRYLRVYSHQKLQVHLPDVFRHFRNHLLDLSTRIREYSQLKKAEACIARADARLLPLGDKTIDLIITSPPYGEERNTIPYVRWAKLFLLWLGLQNTDIVALEKDALGGRHQGPVPRRAIPSVTFWRSIRGTPAPRLTEALPFMKDYLIALREMHRVLKPGGRCCIVIGHRSVNRRLIDMGAVTEELASVAGLAPEESFGRVIPKKMIPWRTPTGDTIFDETIVILRKRR